MATVSAESLPQNEKLDQISESVKQVDDLEQILSRSDAAVSEMKDAVDKIDKKHPKEMAKLKKLLNDGADKKLLLSEIKQVNFKLADQTLVIEDQSSAELAVHQMQKLHDAWEEIKKAYQIEMESKEAISKIDAKKIGRAHV